jgi:hypothetical protein
MNEILCYVAVGGRYQQSLVEKDYMALIDLSIYFSSIVHYCAATETGTYSLKVCCHTSLCFRLDVSGAT